MCPLFSAVSAKQKPHDERDTGLPIARWLDLGSEAFLW